ncbi:MAG: aldehyde dehydrogenase family protein, partial [Qipengyuania sp.]
ISGHPDIDMVSFTGSTRAGIAIAQNAAPTVKRVAQELGGKSPNIILDDGAFTRSVMKGTTAMMGNSGQTCTAPSRMLVPHKRMEEAKAAAKEAAEAVIPGDPRGNATIGPVVSRAQWEKIQRLIESGIEEGATLVAGGPGKPEGLETGHYVKPTVFADVTNDMEIAREEIFGPVLAILGYEDYDDAISIANDTEYGLASHIMGEDVETAKKLSRKIRAGRVAINGGYDLHAAFGGYKKSGNGREWGKFGFDEFLEVKAVMGYDA